VGEEMGGGERKAGAKVKGVTVRVGEEIERGERRV
jgi:hypothetical protein